MIDLPVPRNFPDINRLNRRRRVKLIRVTRSRCPIAVFCRANFNLEMSRRCSNLEPLTQTFLHGAIYYSESRNAKRSRWSLYRIAEEAASSSECVCSQKKRDRLVPRPGVEQQSTGNILVEVFTPGHNRRKRRAAKKFTAPRCRRVRRRKIAPN